MNAAIEGTTEPSQELLSAGLLALQRHDLDAADGFLQQLAHEGTAPHYRELAAAFVVEAAR